MTSAASAMRFLPITKAVISALNPNTAAINQRRGNLFPGRIIYLLRRGSCHLHTSGAFLLRKSPLINQANAFVLIHRQRNKRRGTTGGRKFTNFWHRAYLSAFFGSWHLFSSLHGLTYILFYGIMKQIRHMPFIQLIISCFLAYVNHLVQDLDEHEK